MAAEAEKKRLEKAAQESQRRIEAESKLTPEAREILRLQREREQIQEQHLLQRQQLLLQRKQEREDLEKKILEQAEIDTHQLFMQKNRFDHDFRIKKLIEDAEEDMRRDDQAERIRGEEAAKKVILEAQRIKQLQMEIDEQKNEAMTLAMEEKLD